jgi:hypothetical protein
MKQRHRSWLRRLAAGHRGRQEVASPCGSWLPCVPGDVGWSTPPRLRARLKTPAATGYAAAPDETFELGLHALLDGLEKQHTGKAGDQ